MNELLALIERIPLASILTAIGFVVVTLVGGIVTITNPDTLPFSTYVAFVTGATGATGLLGIGRGAAARRVGSTTPEAGETFTPPPTRSIHR